MGIFVDFRKAYDRVSQEGLYRILEHRGIQGKFLHLIRNMYRNSEMAVRACGKLSPPFNMLRGNRQGCPLSPLLFIMFVDHVLEETNPRGCGLEVPTSKRKDPTTAKAKDYIEIDGGLYADDLVCFEDSLENAKARCELLVEWGEKWGMEQNFEKCGILLWSYDKDIRSAYEEMTFHTKKGTFPKVTQYTYLGIVVTEDLPAFMGRPPQDANGDGRTDAYRHALSRVDRGMKVLSMLKPILQDRSCPLPLKVELVRSFILSVMMYGGEFIGFNKKNAVPIQRVMDLVTRWMAGVRKSNKRVAGLTLSVEMGLPIVYEYMAGMRARLYHKLKFGVPKMQTYLPLLQAAHKFHPQSPWCSENELWLKSFHTPKSMRGKKELANSGVNKYAPKFLVPTTEDPAGYFSDPVSKELNEAKWDGMIRELTDWWLLGQRGDPPKWSAEDVRKNFTLSTLNSSAPIRSWFTFARMCELHRRSNSYRSELLRRHKRMLIGVDELGRVLLDPHDLPDPILWIYLEQLGSTLEGAEAVEAAEAFDDDFPIIDKERILIERQLQDMILANAQSNDGAKRLLVREVRECALERIMDVDGGRLASFSSWYDTFQFGATRDFLRTSLSRHDLIEGVRWLVLVRVGGFPRTASFR